MEARIGKAYGKAYEGRKKRAGGREKWTACDLLALCRGNAFLSAEVLRKSKLFSKDTEDRGLERAVARAFPAYRNDLDAIDEMREDPYHAELNAQYYLRTGRLLTEDYHLPVFDWAENHALRELNERAAREAWEEFEEKRRRLFLSVAEGLWNYPAFAKKYRAVFSEEEMNAYYEYCKRVFIEDRVFLSLEWLLFSCPQWQGRKAFLYENPCTAYFLRAHGTRLALLPKSVFGSRTLRKILMKKYKNEKVKEYFQRRK